MDFEKFTERCKGFIQSAQTMALRNGHQRLTPEHLAQVLLADKEGLAANLIRAAGGDPVKALKSVEAALDKLPKVEGPGSGGVHLTPELARLFDQVQQIGQLALGGPHALDGHVQLVAFAHDLLGFGGVIPQVGILGQGVQLVQAHQRRIPVEMPLQQSDGALDILGKRLDFGAHGHSSRLRGADFLRKSGETGN